MLWPHVGVTLVDKPKALLCQKESSGIIGVFNYAGSKEQDFLYKTLLLQVLHVVLPKVGAEMNEEEKQLSTLLFEDLRALCL